MSHNWSRVVPNTIQPHDLIKRGNLEIHTHTGTSCKREGEDAVMLVQAKEGCRWLRDATEAGRAQRAWTRLTASEGTSPDKALGLELLVPITLFCFFFPPTLQGRQSFPDQGSNPCLLQWKPRVLTTGLPGKSFLLINILTIL